MAPTEPTPFTRPTASPALCRPPKSCAAAPERSASGPNRSTPTTATPNAFSQGPFGDQAPYAQSAPARRSNPAPATTARGTFGNLSDKRPNPIVPTTPPTSNPFEAYPAVPASRPIPSWK